MRIDLGRLTTALLLAAAIGGAATAYGSAADLYYRAKAAKTPAVTVPVSPEAVPLRGSQDERGPPELRRGTPEIPRKVAPPKRKTPMETQLAAIQGTFTRA